MFHAMQHRNDIWDYFCNVRDAVTHIFGQNEKLLNLKGKKTFGSSLREEKVLRPQPISFDALY